MPDIPKKPELAEARNGVVTPLYFDRQVIRAEDLTLDRTSHDRELARMRRILHGWGVVAGLIPTIKDDKLIISAGYGITRTGDEIYLTEALEVTDIAGHVWGCCGSGKSTCEVISPEERRDMAQRLKTETVTARLVARPTQATGSPRPGIAEGCAHPANGLLPSRACDVVTIELLCELELPQSFTLSKRDCKDLTGFFCNDPVPMLPMPPEPSAQYNFLVLGQITAGPKSVTFSPQDRRTVLPLSLVQDWLQSCQCPARTDGSPPLEPSGPLEPSEPWDDGMAAWDHEPELGLNDAVDRLVGNGFQVIDGPRSPPAGIPDTQPSVPKVLTDPDIRGQLNRAGITTIGELLATDNVKLAKTLGITAPEAETLKAEIKPLGVFVTRGGF